MASRQEEKQRLREERIARERAEKARAARRKRVQIALGGVGGLAVIAVVALLASGVLGSDSSADAGAAPEPVSGVTLPAQAIGDVEQAAKAAGCTLAHPAIEGAQHDERAFKASDYKTNPPTSGPHFPEWYEDGVYEPGDTPELGKLVHTLEHGRINVQYKLGTPSETVQQLEALLAEESDGYHMLLYENTTNMDAQVAATAWGHSVTCPTMNDKVFDALRTFRAEYVDKGPEKVD